MKSRLIFLIGGAIDDVFLLLAVCKRKGGYGSMELANLAVVCKRN